MEKDLKKQKESHKAIENILEEKQQMSLKNTPRYCYTEKKGIFRIWNMSTWKIVWRCEEEWRAKKYTLELNNGISTEEHIANLEIQNDTLDR